MGIPFFSWLFLMTLHSLFPSFCMSIAFGQCLGDQQSLLLHLKKNLVFHEELSTKLVHWNENTDCCLWEGVTCGEGRVIGLDLSSEAISDGLDNSSSLFDLQYLQNLSLANNSLWNEIPSELDRLTNLIYLNLSNNGFSGQIPIAISRLTRLVILDLSHNFPISKSESYDSRERRVQSLKLEKPNLKMLIQNLSELIEIHLDRVNISGSGNEWCEALSSSLPNLRVLSLCRCRLSGPIHPSLLKLRALTSIDLHNNNNLSTSVPDFFGNFKSLTRLFLSNSGLYGTFPKRVFQLQPLEILDLSGNTLLGGTLPDFSSLGRLRILLLKETKFSGVLPDSFGKLTKLSTIDLHRCNFSGSIPESMASFTQLVYLDLSSNHFSGRIPSFSMANNLNEIHLSSNDLTGHITSTDWSKFQNLEVLDFSGNSLTGNIPVSLFTLPLLHTLILSKNRFSGQLDEFSNVSSDRLSEVDLRGNSLEGPIPTSVFELPGLGRLSLASNNFSGSLQLDDMIQQLTSLFDLDLSHNNLLLESNETNSSLASLVRLSALRLASNKLKKIPDFLRNLSQLSLLNLSDNQIHGEIPNWIWSLGLLSLDLSYNCLVSLQGPLPNVSRIEYLNLKSNQLQGPLPVFTTEAYVLDFSRNNFSSIPTDIGMLFPYANFLSLSSNKFNKSIPASICRISSLQVLDMSNNSFSGSIPQCLFEDKFLSLAVLNLESNNLSGKISDTFPRDCGLQALTLNGNQLEGGLPKSLEDCKFLEVLELGDNHFQDIFPCYMKNISSLRVLVLRSNKFYGSIGCPGPNATWPMLRIIDLASNNFSGNLPNNSLARWKAMTIDEDGNQLKPKSLGFESFYGIPYYQYTLTTTMKGREVKLEKILNIFTSVDFSCNNFDGHIPEELGGLKYLKILNLSHNAFTGQIPSTLGKLSNLESLDLSSNELTGEIPLQLANGLIFLSALNLSFNQLVGRIPLIKQFATFSETSYEENKGLCGFPLEENCSSNGVPKSPPPIFEETHSKSRTLVDGNFLSAELGFVFGFGIVIGPLMFWKRWRFWYSKQIDEILFNIFPKLDLIGGENCRRAAHRNRRRRNEG